MATATRKSRTANPGTERYSFKPCGCSNRAPHGYFHGPDGGRAFLSPLFVQSRAIGMLDGWIEDGSITAEQKDAIMEDIRSSGLPEKDPYFGPFSFRFDSEDGGIFVGKDPELPFGNGSYIGSKEAARGIVEASIKEGIMLEEEREKLFGEINASAMPELEKYAPEQDDGFEELLTILGVGDVLATLLGRRLLKPLGPVTFEVKQEGDAPPVGIFMSNGKAATHPIKTKATAMDVLLGGVEVGLVNKAYVASLTKAINESNLPAE